MGVRGGFTARSFLHDCRPPGRRDVAADGTEYELQSHVLDFDPLRQQMSMEMEAFMWRSGELVARDEQLLTLTSISGTRWC